MEIPTALDKGLSPALVGNLCVHKPHIDVVMPLKARRSLNYGTPCSITEFFSDNRDVVNHGIQGSH